MMGIAIVFFIVLGAVMGVIFWQRRKKIQKDLRDAVGKFKEDWDDFKKRNG